MHNRAAIANKFLQGKMHLLAVWAYLQTKITDVPTLSYT